MNYMDFNQFPKMGIQVCHRYRPVFEVSGCLNRKTDDSHPSTLNGHRRYMVGMIFGQHHTVQIHHQTAIFDLQ